MQNQIRNDKVDAMTTRKDGPIQRGRGPQLDGTSKLNYFGGDNASSSELSDPFAGQFYYNRDDNGSASPSLLGSGSNSQFPTNLGGGLKSPATSLSSLGGNPYISAVQGRSHNLSVLGGENSGGNGVLGSNSNTVFSSSSSFLNDSYHLPPRQPGYSSAAALGYNNPLAEKDIKSPLPDVPSLDMSEFPSLTSRVGGLSIGGDSESSYGGSRFSLSSSDQAEFKVQKEDFPALGVNTASGSDKSQESLLDNRTAYRFGAISAQDPVVNDSGIPRSPSGAAGVVGQKLPQKKASAQEERSDKYGLLGLLGVIRMTDPNLNTLALGTDLTTLGLNLNSPDCLYASFASPWAEAPSTKEPQFTLPVCYYMQPPALKTSHLSKFQLETLFYIFYAMPKDILQAYAAKELYSREWKYHCDLKLWFKRATQSDGVVISAGLQYIYFDINAWERRLFAGNPSGLAAGLMSEDEVRVNFPS